jgi:hypothetical protein
MKLRVFVFGLAWTCCLFGQKRFDFTESCFRNPALPYCPQRDFVVKPPKGKTPGIATPGETLSTIDAAGIDWRFADPSADALAVLKCTNLSSAPLAQTLIDQLSSHQSLTPEEAQKSFRALSGVNQVALSVREDQILLMITGRPADSILPAPKANWKATQLEGNVLLIGHSDAVDQAVRRLSSDSQLGELGLLAQRRTGDGEFWAAWSAKVAGREAVSAGAKRFELTTSMTDRLISYTTFEFDEAPDQSAIHAWLGTLGDSKIEGNAVRVRTSMEADEMRKNFGQVALSPLGQRLGVIVGSARYLPLRDSASTVHTKPVIYGLDDGPREVK